MAAGPWDLDDDGLVPRRSKSLGSDKPGMALEPIMESSLLLRSPLAGVGGLGMSSVRVGAADALAAGAPSVTGWFTSMMLDVLEPSPCSSGNSSSM